MSGKPTGEERLPEQVELQEVDERHYLALQVFRRRNERGDGWSQDELARRAGMTQPQIARLEAGQANPTLRTLVKLAHALDCRVGELVEPEEAHYVRELMDWNRERRALKNVRDIPGVRVSTAVAGAQGVWGEMDERASNRVVDDGFAPQTRRPDPSTVAA